MSPPTSPHRLNSTNNRRLMNRGAQSPLATVLVLILFVGGVIALIVSARKTYKKEEYRTSVAMICTNPTCGKTFRKKMLTKDAFLPHVTCPYCNQKEAFRVVQCRRCRTLIPLIPGQGPKGNPFLNLTCPNCGSEDIEFDSSVIVLPGEEEKRE
jgi:hypothetical protein